ncbi:MAG: hypothetical protein DME04_26440 [Candidatus Rokuibacteriota bacterium]|nr:MAG: hypothetical protein DME04_26440 [Candidatus Rokubacteria bacterium]
MGSRTLLMILALAAASPAYAHVSRTADEVVAEVRRATEQYRDIARARADGFVQISGMEARHGYHFINVNSPLLAATGIAAGQFDLARPPMLLYVERDSVWRLVGVEYALPSPPVPNPLPGAEWHRHEASCHYRDYRELPAPRAAECAARHPESGEPFVLWHPAFAVAHVWAWDDNPDGPFAEENRALAAYGGSARLHPGHRAPRSAPELAYSQVTHRVAGSVLLLLASVIAWESWRRRPFPWSALSSALWILFGLYLIPTSDPESWPWGPGRFVEIFTDSLVLQHKALAMVPIIFGVVGILRGAGVIERARTTVLVPVLAVLAGASLFVHFHDGHFHMDAIYIQHAAMGATAVSAGVMLFLARRTARGEAVIRWAWPGVLALLGLLLLVYVEA